MYPAIEIGNVLTLHTYGMLVALGVLGAMVYLRMNASRHGIAPDAAVDALVVAVLAGFAGARLFYVVQFWHFFEDHWVDALKIWEGGIVVYGGLTGGFLGLWIFSKARRLSTRSLLDIFGPAAAIGQGFGRIGCLLNGCCYGLPTNLPWGVHLPGIDRPLHPTQLYESSFCFLLAALLHRMSRGTLPKGALITYYFLFYAAGRFVIEFFRGDHEPVAFHLTTAQLISAVVVVLSAFALSRLYHNER